MSYQSAVAKDKQNSNSLSYERAYHVREKPQVGSFVIWDTGRYSVSEYTEIGNWSNYISEGVNILRFDIQCIKRYCKEGVTTLDIKRITNFTPIPENTQTPSGGIMEIPGVSGIIIITNPGAAFIAKMVWEIQQKK
jgi:hypothetical protein